MSANNTFTLRRFANLWRQHVIHNSRMLIYGTVGFCGAVFLVLFLGQLMNDGEAFGIGPFLNFGVGFVAIFGIIYVGYAFPAFRSREKAFGYLTVPASSLEKFVFEFFNRIGLALIALPLLYWLTFNLEGAFFEMISRDVTFSAIGIADFRAMDGPEEDMRPFLKVLILGLIALAIVLPFTGGAAFGRQPLVKTMFALTLIFIFYFGLAFMVVEIMGVGKYNPNDSMWLFPYNEDAAVRFFGSFVVIANLVMLSVAFLKLKEKEA